MRMLFITKVLQVVSLAFACVFATGGALARTLVPYKRAQSSVVARNTWKRDIVPKDVVRLDYTKGMFRLSCQDGTDLKSLSS